MFKRKKKGKGKSVQEMLGIKTFTRYGLKTDDGELLFFEVSPVNISVLSPANIEIKIHHLIQILSAIPDIEIICTDSSECFDANKAYLRERLEQEQSEKVRGIIKKDINALDDIQVEMATARQFVFVIKVKNTNEKQVFEDVNKYAKTMADAGFEVRHMSKADIKRFLAIYFEAGVYGELMPDFDGEQYLEQREGD